MNRKNHQTRTERNQQRLDAGFVSTHFPGVESIVISMTYTQKGLAHPIERIVNFYPGSYAIFRLDCLSNDCVDGGFDMTRIINSMIRIHSKTSKGELRCDDNGPLPNHSNIVYKVAIQYA